MAKHPISVIHPNMYNRMLERQGVEGLTVFDGDEGSGLQMSFEDEQIPQVMNTMLNKLLELDTITHMVVPSNARRLVEIKREIESVITDVNDDMSKYEISSYLNETLETLDSVIGNLKGGN